MKNLDIDKNFVLYFPTNPYIKYTIIPYEIFSFYFKDVFNNLSLLNRPLRDN
jgi:hypothetical protein